MADASIMSMIAGYLPASSDPPPAHNPTPTSTKPGGTSAAGGSSAARGRATTCRRVVHMICFSKNRAFQLDQLLGSSKRHLQLVQEKGRDSEGEGQEPAQLRISVLYVASAARSSDAAPDMAGSGVGVVAEQEVWPAGPESAPSPSGSDRTMEESYDIVRCRHPDVRFVRERPGEFCDQLCSLVREETGEPAPASTGDGHEGREERFVLFAVDDMFFYRDFELPGALELLSTDSSTFCIHLRLHPGITWSHTSRAPCHAPPLLPSGRGVMLSQTGHPASSSEDTIADRGCAEEKVGGAPESDGPREPRAVLAADFGLLTFARREGTGEWDYPWDLTGGLYRRGDAVAVVDGIVSNFGKQAAANPNLLEYHGHVLLQRIEDLQSSSTEIGNRGGGTGDGGTSRGGQPSAGALPLPPSEATAAAGPPTTGVVTSAATSSAPPGTGATSVSGAALSAAANAAKAAPRCGCSGRAVVSSIAVNRVQSTYSTPVYASQGGGVEDLDRRLRPRCRALPPGTTAERGGGADGGRARCSLAVGGEGCEEGAQIIEVEKDPAGEEGGKAREGGGLDGRAYRRRVFNSVHVGELLFKGDGATEGEGGAAAADTTTRPGSVPDTLTVLLPVRDGGDLLIDAVESVLSCAQEMPSGWGVELLIVDDGSEDGAVERAVAALAGEAGRSNGDVATRVLRHEQGLGLAESLNEGLREARGNLVARMDADDVCMPGRLEQQVTFMLEHPCVAVLGTSVATFSGTTIRQSVNGTRVKDYHTPRPPTDTAVHLPASGVQRISRHPADPAFLAWSMLFSCCLAHPSVMMRRDRVLDVGGYDPTTEPAEDYDLWLRMQSSAPGCVANVGEVLVGLRKHDHNVSRQRRVEQDVAADEAAARTMTRLLTGQGPGRVVTPAQAAVIRRPETAASPGELADAARLLGDLGAAAVTAAVEQGGEVMARNSDVEKSCNAVCDPPQGEGGGHECEKLRRGRDMVARDIEARLGAMGVQAMSRFGGGAAPVLDEWKKRFPDRPLLFSLGGGR